MVRALQDLGCYMRFLVAALLCGAFSAHAAPAYRLAATVSLGPPERWDYLTFDPGTQRVFVAHGSEITVIDARSLRVAGRVGGFAGAHGVRVVPGGAAYAASGEAGAVHVFDPRSLAPLATVATGPDSDALAYDAATRLMAVMTGGPGTVVLIDTRMNRVAARIAAGGDLESAAADGRGTLYANLVDAGAVLRIDLAARRVTARWQLPDCVAPHGMAVDGARHRAYVTCENGHMAVLDTDSGRQVAAPPIGRGSDAADLDPGRGLAFSSNGEGNVSLISLGSNEALPPLVTAPAARTMAVDAAGGRLFLVTADIAGSGPPRHPGGPPSHIYKPGSVKLLVYEPAD